MTGWSGGYREVLCRAVLKTDLLCGGPLHRQRIANVFLIILGGPSELLIGTSEAEGEMLIVTGSFVELSFDTL